MNTVCNSWEEEDQAKLNQLLGGGLKSAAKTGTSSKDDARGEQVKGKEAKNNSRPNKAKKDRNAGVVETK